VKVTFLGGEKKMNNNNKNNNNVVNNKKGQTMGSIIMVAIAVIVGLICFQIIAQQVGSSTNTVAVANKTLGAASNSTTVYLTDYQALGGTIVVWNGTTSVVPASNYTVTNNVVYNGVLAVSVLPKTPLSAGYQGYTWYISGTAEPAGYISDSSARSMVALITVFFAIGILAVAMLPAIKDGLSNLQ
jgi:hypothetical protein